MNNPELDSHGHGFEASHGQQPSMGKLNVASNGQINRLVSSGAACKRSAKENNSGTALAQHNLHGGVTTSGFAEQNMKFKMISSTSGSIGGHGHSGKTSHKALSNRNQSFNTANSSGRMNAVNPPALITSQNARDGPTGPGSALSTSAVMTHTNHHMH